MYFSHRKCKGQWTCSKSFKIQKSILGRKTRIGKAKNNMWVDVKLAKIRVKGYGERENFKCKKHPEQKRGKEKRTNKKCEWENICEYCQRTKGVQGLGIWRFRGGQRAGPTGKGRFRGEGRGKGGTGGGGEIYGGRGGPWGRRRPEGGPGRRLARAGPALFGPPPRLQPPAGGASGGRPNSGG